MRELSSGDATGAVPALAGITLVISLRDVAEMASAPIYVRFVAGTSQMPACRRRSCKPAHVNAKFRRFFARNGTILPISAFILKNCTGIIA